MTEYKPYVHKLIDGSYGGAGGGASLTEVPSGSAESPSIAFADSLTTGIYNPSDGVIGFSSQGILSAGISATGVNAYVPVYSDFPSSMTGPNYSILESPSTGLYSKSHMDGYLGLSVEGYSGVQVVNRKVTTGLVMDFSRDDNYAYDDSLSPFSFVESSIMSRFKYLTDSRGFTMDAGVINSQNNSSWQGSSTSSNWLTADVMSYKFKIFSPAYGKKSGVLMFSVGPTNIASTYISILKDVRKIQLLVVLGGVTQIDRISTNDVLVDDLWQDVEVTTGSAGNRVFVDGVEVSMTDTTGTEATTTTISDFATSTLTCCIGNGRGFGTEEMIDCYVTNIYVQEPATNVDNLQTRISNANTAPFFEITSSGVTSDASMTFTGDKAVTLKNHSVYPVSEVEYYFVGGAVTDSSGNGRTLTVSGSPTYSRVLGKEGVTLSGSEYLYNDALGSSLAGDVAVLSMWFKTTSTTDGITLFNVDEIVTVTNNYLQVVMRSGVSLGGNPLSGDIQIVNTPNRGYVSTNNGYNDGRWHHLVINLLTTGFSMYIDGVAPSIYTVSGTVGDDQTLDSSMDRAFIGSISGGSNFVGSISDVVLSKTEITQSKALEVFRGFDLTGNSMTVDDMKTAGLTTDDFVTGQFSLLDGGQALYNVLVSDATGSVANAQYSSTENLTGNYAGAYTGTADIQLSRIGSQVVMTVTDTGDQTAVATSSITYSSISSQFRPLNDIEMPIRVKEMGIYQFGLISINTSGVITFFSNATGGNFTTATTLRLSGFTCSWNVL